MREIKFRIWDGLAKKMQPVKQLWFPIPHHMQPDYLQVMQFTGLLDRNGKEIYEGDIVKHPRGNCEVYFNHGAFVITYPDSKQWRLLNHGGAEAVEILGNVHESPELLTT